MRPWAAAPSGIVLAIRLTPKGGRDAVDGVDTLSDGRSVLKVRVRAVPQEGEANEALCRLIAKSLSVAPRDVALTSGATSRVKRLTISGDAMALVAALEKLDASR